MLDRVLLQPYSMNNNSVLPVKYLDSGSDS